MARSPSICGIILASGSSTRIGRDKALLPWPAGAPASLRNTFLGAYIELLRAHSDMVTVLGGANSRSLAPIVYSMGAYLLENHAPELGQFSSLKIALHDVLNRGRDSAIVALIDCPPVRPETLTRLHSAFLSAIEQDFWAVVPEYDQRPGHPYILSREMIEALLRAPITVNARDILKANETRIRYVPVDDPHVVLNIETQEDYARLVAEST